MEEFMSSINIKTTERRFPVAKNLYGIFFEDINRAGDGGLYPEMLRNRSFEDSIPPKECTTEGDDDYAIVTPSGWRDEFNHGEGLSRWIRDNEIAFTPIPAWYCENSNIKLDREDTLNNKRSTALSVEFHPQGFIYNTGFVGIPQKEGEKYNFYMFAKVEEPTEVILSIEEDGVRLCESVMNLYGNGFVRYDTEFTAIRTTGNAIFVMTCPNGGKIKLGFTSLMPADTYNGHGLRRDLVEKLRDMHPTFLRFPGGCIVEGFTPSTAMRFKNIIGPVWERPGHLLMWHYRTSNGLGYHEYLQLCEDLMLEPLYVFNCGMTCQARNSVLMEGQELEEMIQDTLDAIEYAIAPADSKWGKIRADMGHPEPYKMNYVEIGNENWGPDYEERYLKCYKIIKEKYPWMIFVANHHVEEKGFPVDIVDEHYYDSVEYFAENIGFYDNYDRKGPNIFLGELAVLRGPVGQLYAAIGEAMFLIGMERNQDIVSLASYAPLLENYHYYAWYPNLLIFDNLRSYCIPTYYAWKLFGGNRGNYVVLSQDETGVLYRPVKGMASLIGPAGVKYRKATWNGNPVKATHEVMGHEVVLEEGYGITEPDEEQKKESSTMGVKPDEILVVFGDNEEETEGTFEIEIFAEEGREIGIGVYSSRISKEMYMNDETHPPREWNAGIVRPFQWRIKGGKSTFQEKHYPEPIALTSEASVKLTMGAYNKFKYVVTGKKMSLSINDVLVQEASVPSFPAMAAVVCDTEQEVIVKIVNMSPDPDDINISLDCDVENEYKVNRLTGGKYDENTIDNPTKVQDIEVKSSGASKQFVYRAPAYSLNIIHLNKKEAINKQNNL
ncbi:MAG: Alpha-L-arabinofuranosidase [Herbinix sp.]|nr:Alpha-L-arabinofuranosidase [Herbinix sp.]